MAAGPDSVRTPEYRYAAVFVLTVILLMFEILLPDASWARALALALEGAALVVVVATSGPRRVRRARAYGTAVVALVLVGLGAANTNAAFLLSALVSAAIPLALAGGLVRLVRERGVTLQAVAGGLTIYLLAGLLFGLAIAFISHVSDGAFFAQGTNVNQSDRVYYSFTVLTTTGFGDLTASTRIGRALAVIEMLLGQLYLVTVVGVLVGNLVSRQRRT